MLGRTNEQDSSENDKAKQLSIKPMLKIEKPPDTIHFSPTKYYLIFSYVSILRQEQVIQHRNRHYYERTQNFYQAGITISKNVRNLIAPNPTKPTIEGHPESKYYTVELGEKPSTNESKVLHCDRQFRKYLILHEIMITSNTNIR